jgi:hypothetical protein
MPANGSGRVGHWPAPGGAVLLTTIELVANADGWREGVRCLADRCGLQQTSAHEVANSQHRCCRPPHTEA